MQSFVKLPPTQFFKQTHLIKKTFEKWIKDTNILEIRKRVATPSHIDDSMTPEEKRKAVDDFRRRQSEQRMANFSTILDALLDEHPDETIELMALICCVPVEEVDSHPFEEYFECIMKVLQNEVAVNFFTSCMQLAQMGTPE